MSRFLVLLFVISCLASTQVLANKASSKQCHAWQKKIDLYTKKRQQGGSASQMNKWHKARKKYKVRYTEGGCRKGKNMGRL